MVKKFINYCYDGDIVGRDVKLTVKLYKVYCKLFEIEEVDNIANRICNEYRLFIEKGVFTK